MKKIFALFVVFSSVLTLTACKKGLLDDVDFEGTTVKVNMSGENDKRLLTYLHANSLEMPGGKTIKNGDLKPMWQYVAEQTKVVIKDTATPGQKPADMMDFQAATQFADSTVFGGPNLGERIMAEGAKGNFVNLKDYLTYMPNFKAYLKANPLVEKAITAYDGKVYHIPYIAEINNYARMFEARYSWVTLLLDGKVNGTTTALESETATMTVAYNNFWNTTRATAGNVITKQNAKATNNVLTAENARVELVNYIKATYPQFASEPSKLFLGHTAQYDIDELVALLRVIKLHPRTLSKEAKGTVNEAAVITPFYTRQTAYREEILRLIPYFAGQRVHGSDSYGSRFYIDEKGELQYSYYQDKFLDGLDRIKQMASEGLFNAELAGTTSSTDIRKGYIFSDAVTTNNTYGFMCYDFTSSTTALNGGQDDVKAILPPLTTTPMSNNKFVHYVENTRVVKGDGWGISAKASKEELRAALEMFDFFFSADGVKVQNYGTPDLWVAGETFTFNGETGPKFTQWTKDKAAAVAGGDMSAFLRDHVGAQMPIGYQKFIGFEIQSTSQNGLWSWDLYNGKLAKDAGVKDAKAVLTNSYSAKDTYYQLVPPVFSLTPQETSLISETTGMKTDTNLTDALFAYIFSKPGSKADKAAVKQMYKDAGIETYIDIYRDAYNRVK